jgi:DNA-binding NarL/FixJ family response regulator
MHSHRRLVREILKAGASGYLLKECAFAELIQAIHLIIEKNQIYLCPAISRLVMDDYLQHAEKEKNVAKSLTPKEREILQLIAEGNTSREIAKIMNMGVRTVEKHRLNLTQKLNIKSVAELVKYALREGLTNP